MEVTIGKIMGLISFLFGIAIALYFIFRPKHHSKIIVYGGNPLEKRIESFM